MQLQSDREKQYYRYFRRVFRGPIESGVGNEYMRLLISSEIIEYERDNKIAKTTR